MTGRDPDRPERPLSDLRARIARLRARDAEAKVGRSGRADISGSGVVLRVGIELVGTLAVGVAIGWGLDRWLGTGPWLLVVFFFLGAAAGVLNVYRAVSPIGLAPGYRPDGDADRDAGGEGSGGGTDEKR
jgi:ATP synthase protein I